MTFIQICKQHQAGKDLKFTHPDLMHHYVFDGDGELRYVNDFGRWLPMPFWLSDFDRDDWNII